MAETPREAVEFARMLVRAFYPDEFVILMDAVLRMNNYCAHGKLAQRLGIPPKELRQMLTRMDQARLMKSDKRTQKKVNIHDERRPSRTVTTEFWYVPLGNVVDAFAYRVHKLSREVEKKRASERERQKWVCGRCQTEYQLLDILQWANSNGAFICEKVDVRADRRPHPCGGRITEEDNTAQVKETERVKQLLDDELRGLRERAAVCANMDIPNHPLEGADEKTWEEVVPETVGMHGEKVDENGMPIAEKETVKLAGDGAAVSSVAAPAAANPLDDDTIPEKPTWFKDTQGDDADDDWDSEQENVVDIKKGTASSINADEEKAYMERYLRKIGGVAPETADSNQTDAKPQSSVGPEPSTAADGAKESQTGQQAGTIIGDTDDTTVSVAGKQVKLSQVTEEMKEQMTDEEYGRFVEAQRNAGGMDDDDDDEFE